MFENGCDEIVGTSAHSDAIRRFTSEAAKTNAPVMLVGEPGVGKDFVARRVHVESRRRDQPFLMIDCSLYYERELKREVFGYHGIGKTAKSRKGLFEFASRGTCYLSRIEEITPSLQQDLFDFLNTGKFRRLGDGRERTSQVRLIVSTDKNLRGFVEGGLFRSDLHGALSPTELQVAPLRERNVDVVALALCLAEESRRDKELVEAQKFSDECLEALKCFPWPRNFDELKKEVGRLLEIKSETLNLQDLSFEISSFWMGLRGDPEVRKVIEELDGYIREFQVLSHLEAEFGDILFNIADWEAADEEEQTRNLLGQDFY